MYKIAVEEIETLKKEKQLDNERIANLEKDVTTLREQIKTAQSGFIRQIQELEVAKNIAISTAQAEVTLTL